MEHTRNMRPTPHADRVLRLLSSKGLLRPINLDEIGVPRMVLTRMTKTGLVKKIARGLYRLPDIPSSERESFAAISAKVPRAVFCLLTALQIHELTTQLPRQVWIAMPRGSHKPKIDYPPIKMIQMTAETHLAGIDLIDCDQVNLRVYCVAKTVADCFKHRNKIGLDVALDALKEARAKKLASADDLWRYAKICRVANVMRPYLEMVE